MLSTMLCAVLAAGAALLCLRRVIGQKRFVPLAKAAGLCLLLGLFQLAPFCMYSMQGIGAGTLVNDLTVNAVEPGQILMMGAGSASGSSANQKVLAFSAEIGLPLLIGAMLALYAALQKPERGENEKAVLRLLACGAALAVAATDFFPWGPVSTLTGRQGWLLRHVAAADVCRAAAGAGRRLWRNRAGREAPGRGGGRCAVHGGGLCHADALRRTAWGQIH